MATLDTAPSSSACLLLPHPYRATEEDVSAQLQILLQAPPQDIGQMAGQENCVLKVLSCLQLWVSTEGQDGGSYRTQVVTHLDITVGLF